MATDKPQTQPAEAAKPAKRFSMKVVIALVAMLVIEGLTIVVTFSLAGGPAPVHAEEKHSAKHDEGAEEVEALVVRDRFANSRRGDVYIYDTEVYLVTRQRHLEDVTAKLESQSAQIRADIATAFRRAEPSYMQEDALQTLSRQIKAMLDERFGHDAEGRPVIERVLITRCTEYKVNN